MLKTPSECSETRAKTNIESLNRLIENRRVLRVCAKIWGMKFNPVHRHVDSVLLCPLCMNERVVSGKGYCKDHSDGVLP